jgi:hypothetical protein
MNFLFESQFRRLIRNLLIEGKIDVLQARYPHIDVDEYAKIDPTPQKKYLQWMVVRKADRDPNATVHALEDIIKKFHGLQQRLQPQQRDINQYKTVYELDRLLTKFDDVSKTQQRKVVKSEGARHVGTVGDYDIYFVTSHQAAQLLGNGTRWCITQSDGKHWDEYVRNVKFFFAIQKQPQGHPLDKIAFACYLYSDDIEAFDAQDKSIHKSVDYDLLQFIRSIKNQYKNYTVTSQNQTIIFVNGQIEGPVKTTDRIEWYKNGKLHREDGPAIEYSNGEMRWFQNNQPHREDGPAIIESDGTQWWYQRGELHREREPAVEYSNGTKYWYKNGQRHREDGPAIEYAHGHKEWWIRGKLHREDGPAIIESDGTQWWYKNSERIKPPQ